MQISMLCIYVNTNIYIEQFFYHFIFVLMSMQLSSGIDIEVKLRNDCLTFVLMLT